MNICTPDRASFLHCPIPVRTLLLVVSCLLLFLPHLPTALHATPFLLRKQLTRTEGLPSNTVSNILRDRQGIFWILTAKGICRYDGQRVYPFPLPANSNPEKNLSALEQSLTICAEDSSGALWFGTKGGLLRFLPRIGAWRWYKKTGGENAIMNYIRTLFCDSRGILWIGTRAGLLQYNAQKDSCIEPFLPLPRGEIQNIGENKDGTLWFGISDKPLTAYNPRTNKIITAVLKGSENGFQIHRLSNDKGVWISFLSHSDQTMQAPRLVTTDTTKNTFAVSASAFPLSAAFLKGIDVSPYAEDERGAWYAYVNDYAAGRCQSGLYCITPQLGSYSGALPKVEQAADSTFFREQILRGKVTAFYRDPQTGIVCVGIAEQGVTILIPTGMDKLSDFNSIGDVRCLYTDRRGRLWCGTRKGLFLRTRDTFVQVRQQSASQQSLQNGVKINSDMPMYDVQETSTGTIIVASSGGLFRYDEFHNTLRPFAILTAAIGVTTVRRVHPDPFSNEFWVNVPSIGLLRCGEDGSVREYFEFGQSAFGTGAPTLGTSIIFTMQFDKRSDLWMGGMGVLLRWRRQIGQIERLTALPNTVLTLQPTKLIPIETESFLVTLPGIGLVHINTSIPAFTETLVPQYIRTAPINSRLRDVDIMGGAKAKNAFWWTTRTNGIYRAKYGGADNTPNVLSLAQPELLLPSDENATKGSAGEQMTTQTERGSNVGSITSDGQGGVVFDYYGDVLRANHTARAYTDTARVVPIGYFRNDSVMAGLPQHGDTLRCAYNGSFALSCAVVSLARPERHRLEYHLEGVDEVWNVMPDASLRTVRYSSLQPGVYVLSIRTRAQDAYDDEALLSANMLTFRVEVPYPWWMHPVTRTIGFALLAVGFVWVGYAVQHRRTEQRLARLEREKEFENVQRLASEAQMQTLRLQMNPHFLYNRQNVLIVF